MTDASTPTAPEDGPAQATPTAISQSEFQAGFGESLADTLSLGSWVSGSDLASLYGRLEQELSQAISQEDTIRKQIREVVFPRISTAKGAPRHAGVYAATLDNLASTHSGLLFSGQVEAADGSSLVHDTLVLTVVQIAVALVSYHGDQGTWAHRLFRRDLRVHGRDLVQETIELLEKRRQRSAPGVESQQDRLSSMGRRGIMAYAERSVLLNKSKGRWLMGHGSPAPYELLTGSGSVELVQASLTLLNSLLGEHRRFVFVPSAPARELLTIGNALNPLEYAIVDTIEATIDNIAKGHYRGGGEQQTWQKAGRLVEQFAGDVGCKVVRGVYRSSALAPAQVFYAHEDYSHEAALIAMADGALHEHRGFPLLIDLADTVCGSTFGSDSLAGPALAAYAEQGKAYQYATERQTRKS